MIPWARTRPEALKAPHHLCAACHNKSLRERERKVKLIVFLKMMKNISQKDDLRFFMVRRRSTVVAYMSHSRPVVSQTPVYDECRYAPYVLQET
jgi:hypothetical protein